MESCELQAAWFHRATLGRECDVEDRVRLLVTAAFSHPYHVEVDGNRLVRSIWQPPPGATRMTRYADLVETRSTDSLPSRTAAELWNQIDRDVMGLPSIDPAEPLPIDGWFASIEICRDGEYAFFNRSSPDRSPQDAPILDLIERLELLAKLPPRDD